MVPFTGVGSNRRAWLGSIAALALAFVVHVMLGGALGSDFSSLWHALISRDSTWSSVVWDIRLPRALACALVGAILGITGAAFQLLFRNPLAEPFVVGVSGGAAVAITASLSLGLSGLFNELGTMLAAILGGLLTLRLVLALSSVRRGFHSESVLIAGAVISTLLLSMMTVILLVSGKDSSAVLRWMLGSMSPAYWSRVVLLFMTLGIGGFVLIRESRKLNALSLGEVTARSLGVDPNRTGRTILATGAIMSSVAVGATGIIGFLGIIAPNIVRRWVGADARRALPLSAVLGSVLLLLSDSVAQRLLTGQELPVGAITAILGAPALLWILKR